MPDITALWYEQQKLIAAGKLSTAEFVVDVFEYLGCEIARIKAKGIKMDIKMIPCPKCGKAVREIKWKKGKFWACAGSQDGCSAKFKDVSGKPVLIEGTAVAKTTGEKCPQCGSDLVERDSKNDKFIACSGYPKCKWTPAKANKPVDQVTDKKCPKCKKGMLAIKNGKFGEFLACNNYPTCKHIEK